VSSGGAGAAAAPVAVLVESKARSGDADAARTASSAARDAGVVTTQGGYPVGRPHFLFGAGAGGTAGAASATAAAADAADSDPVVVLLRKSGWLEGKSPG
jgi:hypothetical protein